MNESESNGRNVREPTRLVDPRHVRASIARRATALASFDTPRLRRRVASIATVAVGGGIALLGYAGGGDMLSELFGGRRPTPVADTYDAIPAPVVLDSPELDSALHPARATVVAARDTVAAVAADSSTASAADTLAPGDSSIGSATAPPVAQDGSRPASDIQTRSPERDTVARAASGGRKFVVQVRATGDKAEADQLARRLRGRGLRNVSITESVRDGATLYRVRYGQYASEEEARESAARIGLSEIWIIRP
jgi:cell division septation protein DedD